MSLHCFVCSNKLNESSIINDYFKPLCSSCKNIKKKITSITENEIIKQNFNINEFYPNLIIKISYINFNSYNHDNGIYIDANSFISIVSKKIKSSDIGLNGRIKDLSLNKLYLYGFDAVPSAITDSRIIDATVSLIDNSINKFLDN